MAQEQYKEAFEIFPVVEDFELNWTPELLESAVYTYDCAGYTREEAEEKFGSTSHLLDRKLYLLSISNGVMSFSLLKEESKARRESTKMASRLFQFRRTC